MHCLGDIVKLASEFKTGGIVQCIRVSNNPQTHHQALLLLSLAAQLFPSQVLHNIMEIFTFMGTSVLRQDDAYSFQVIFDHEYDLFFSKPFQLNFSTLVLQIKPN